MLHVLELWDVLTTCTPINVLTSRIRNLHILYKEFKNIQNHLRTFLSSLESVAVMLLCMEPLKVLEHYIEII